VVSTWAKVTLQIRSTFLYLSFEYSRGPTRVEISTVRK